MICTLINHKKFKKYAEEENPQWENKVNHVLEKEKAKITNIITTENFLETIKNGKSKKANKYFRTYDKTSKKLLQLDIEETSTSKNYLSRLSCMELETIKLSAGPYSSSQKYQLKKGFRV